MTDAATAPGAEISVRPLTSPAGIICLLALDHRDAMRNAYSRVGIPNVSMETMLAVKSRIVEALAGRASAILLDPAAAHHCRPEGIGLLMPLEEQGHEPLAGGRLNRLTPDFGPAEAAALEADGCKLLLYYRADHAETMVRQLYLVARASEDCHRHGLALVVEPLVYRLEHEDEHAYRTSYADLVVAAAHDLANSGADILKLPYPGDAATCERVTQAAAPLRWVVLGGKDTDAAFFTEQLTTACRAGASGFMAGRPIWGGALALPEAEQPEWLAREAAPLFDRLTEIAHTYARSIP